jgi:hypothetical protein
VSWSVIVGFSSAVDSFPQLVRKKASPAAKNIPVKRFVIFIVCLLIVGLFYGCNVKAFVFVAEFEIRLLGTNADEKCNSLLLIL